MTRIALVQMRCEKNNVKKNLETMVHYMEEATTNGVELIGFPEMNLTGYINPTKYPEAAISLKGPEVRHLLKLTERYPAAIMAGLVEANPSGKPYITQIVIQRGVIRGYYRKITIEDEEVDWFSPGQDVPVFHCGGLTFGIAVCADISTEAVFAKCARQGARIVFELAAPGLYGQQVTRNWQAGYAWWEGECQKYLGRYARDHGIWVGVATQAGRTIDEDFPGGGYLFSTTGERVYATTDHSPGALYLDVDFDRHTAKKLI